jgi:uncharacterized glyoxalase superfamily protein PhnB
MASKPVLNGINLIVKDMAASVDFYRCLGVEISDDAIWQSESGGHHVALAMPSGVGFDLDSEALARSYNAGWTPDSPRCLIGFDVAERDAVDAAYARLACAGYDGLQEPYDAFWGARYAIVRDPDGNHVGIMSAVDDQLRSDPPTI